MPLSTMTLVFDNVCARWMQKITIDSSAQMLQHACSSIGIPAHVSRGALLLREEDNLPRQVLAPECPERPDRTSSVLASCSCIHSFGVVFVSGTLCGVCHTCAYGCCVAFSNFVMDVGLDTPSSPRMKSGASMEPIRKNRKTLKTCCDIR